MFARVEIVPYSHRSDKVGNQAHADWLNWSWQRFHITDSRAKLSHDKTHVDFTCEHALKEFEDTWKHYYRRIY